MIRTANKTFTRLRMTKHFLGTSSSTQKVKKGSLKSLMGCKTHKLKCTVRFLILITYNLALKTLECCLWLLLHIFFFFRSVSSSFLRWIHCYIIITFRNGVMRPFLVLSFFFSSHKLCTMIIC